MIIRRDGVKTVVYVAMNDLQVIVRRNGAIQLLCKGADTMVYERLDKSCAELKHTTSEHLHVGWSYNML